MSHLSSTDRIGAVTCFEYTDDDEPPPPYSEITRSALIADPVAPPKPASTDKALPPLPTPYTLEKGRRCSRSQSNTSKTSPPLISLSPINLSISGNHSLSIAYSLEFRSSQSITLFRSDSDRNPSRIKSIQGSTERASPLYDITRSRRGQRVTVSLESKTGDNFCFFSELCSKLVLHKIQTPDKDNTVWELRYHRNYDFESIIGVQAAGSQTVFICDKKCVWQTRDGKIVAAEGKAGTYYQNCPGLRTGREVEIKLPRIDISAGLDPKFVDLVVACWAAKAYFL